MPTDAPCTALEALVRARSVVGVGGQYLLGAGDYWPHCEEGKPVDLPWTQKGGVWGSDCSGFAISYTWKLPRRRPGFNKGSWATVEDWINSDSALQDAYHHQELFQSILPHEARAGDIIIYPSVYKTGKRILIGHVGFVEVVPSNYTPGDYSALTIIQCHGPNGRKPGVRRTDGSVWEHHDHLWPKPEHRSNIIRVKERQ